MLVSYIPLATIFRVRVESCLSRHGPAKNLSTLLHELFRGAVQLLERKIHRCGPLDSLQPIRQPPVPKMAAMTTIVPPIEWSQRKDGLYVVIKVAEAQDVTVDLQATSLKFACDADEKKYAFDVTFAAEVLPDESVWKVHGRSIQMHVVKKDQEADHWCRLTNDKVFEKRHVATDWSRYVDEDEEDDAGAFDMSALQGADSFAPASADMSKAPASPSSSSST